MKWNEKLLTKVLYNLDGDSQELNQVLSESEYEEWKELELLIFYVFIGDEENEFIKVISKRKYDGFAKMATEGHGLQSSGVLTIELNKELYVINLKNGNHNGSTITSFIKNKQQKPRGNK